MPVASLSVALQAAPLGGGVHAKEVLQKTSLTETQKEGLKEGVREGSTVVLTCHVKANPKVYNVTWFHNVSTLMPDVHEISSIIFITLLL